MDRPETAYVRSNGQVTLPAQVRRAAELQEGDVVEVVLQDDGCVLLRPVDVVDRMQADLVFRLGEQPPPDLTGGLRDRAQELVRRRHLPISAARRLLDLVERFERGDLTRKAFVSEAVILGLPVTSLVALLTAPREAANAAEIVASVAGAGARPAEQRPNRLRITQAFQSLLYLPLYIAYDVGFFEEEGLAVEITTAGGGPQAWSAVESGLADYAVHDPVFTVRAFERGVDDAVVVGTICSGQAIVALAREPDVAPTDDARVFITETVAGRTIATQPEPDSQWALLRFLRFLYATSHSGDVGSSYRNLQTQIGTEPDPVIDGRVELCLAFPPQAEMAMARGLHEIFDFSRFFGPYLLSALTARRSGIQARPEGHEALLRALEKACQYAQAFPEEVIRVAQQEFPGVSEDVIARAAHRCLARHFVPEHAVVGGEAWNENAVLNKFVGSIQQYRGLRELVDNEAALHAYRTLGNLRLSWTAPRQITHCVREASSSAAP